MKHRRYASVLEQKKQDSTLQVLFKVARLLNERALERQHQRAPAQVRVRAAHTALLPHLDLEGTRITTLAERLGISRQAVGQLVDDLEQMGVVRREPDPEDGRAKLVLFTAKGRRGLLDGLSMLQEMEAELAQMVGRRPFLQIARTLRRILAHLES
jgi:DNA-binding MarR family transcriptional regulator